SVVTMSPCDLPLSGRNTRAPPPACQHSGTLSPLYWRQPAVVLPSKSSFQPSAFSLSVSVFGAWSSAARSGEIPAGPLRTRVMAVSHRAACRLGYVIGWLTPGRETWIEHSPVGVL